MTPLRTAAFGAVPLLLAACAPITNRGPLAPPPDPACVVEPNEARTDAGMDARMGDGARAVESGVPSSVPNGVPNGGAPALAPGAIRAAVTTPLDPTHAPWPRTPGERLLFAQLYEPLLRVDCTGHPVGALAASWRRDDSDAVPGTTRWRFVLRAGASFGNGARVAAYDVIASWRRSALAHAREPGGTAIAAIAAGARALDDSTLLVALPESPDGPRLLGAPQFVVALPPPEGALWPDGTMSYDVDSTIDRPGSPPARNRDARPVPAEGPPTIAEITLRGRAGERALVFRTEPHADARDALDAGADLLLTASPAAIQYARTLDDLSTVALPWTRSYVLALPETMNDDAPSPCSASDASRPLRNSLALAVHVDARGADGPCWWDGNTDGGQAARPTPPGGPPRRIVYQVGDETARELAERIVALAAPGREEPAADALRRAAPAFSRSTAWRSAAIDSASFARMLADGSEGAYIFAITRDPEWPDVARARLFEAAPWLATTGRPAHALLPLVDTREFLIFRRSRGIPRMTIMYDGSVVLGAPDAAARRPSP